MIDIAEDILSEFVEACHTAASQGLMRCSSGNISLRLDDDRMLATASGSWAEHLSRNQVSVCRIADGSLLEGPRPTVEIGFHSGILRGRPDVNVVMHFQTPFATTLACQALADTNYFVIPEIPVYIGHISTVPYIQPGSQELTDAVIAAMQDHDMVVMSNHGMVTVAVDYAHAIQNAVFFELACEVIVRSGDQVNPLASEAVDKLLEVRKNAVKKV